MKQSFKKCISIIIALGIMSSAIPAYATNSDVCVNGGVHNLQSVEAKKPTWTEPGYEAYEYCSNTNCGYNTYVAIPALGEPEIDSTELTVFRLNCDGEVFLVLQKNPLPCLEHASSAVSWFMKLPDATAIAKKLECDGYPVCAVDLYGGEFFRISDPEGNAFFISE